MSVDVLRFAVIGDPVAHSKSPAMHSAAFRALALPHLYEAIRATPDELPGLVARLRAGEYAGFNVTVPHKQRILDHVDSIDASVVACGAANTLVRAKDGTVRAYNTDAPALAVEIAALATPAKEALAEGRTRFRDTTAIVLGSGGAARSAVAALAIDLGVARVVVRARAHTDAAARARFVDPWTKLLAAAGSAATLIAAPLAPDPAIEGASSVVVQATSAGMSGASPGDDVAAAVDWDALPVAAVALDVVYAPPETPFLHAAAAHGLRSANGIGMLARQGALAFELWLGVPAPYNAMLTALQ